MRNGLNVLKLTVEAPRGVSRGAALCPAAAAACGSCGATAIAGRIKSGTGPDRDERTEHGERPPDLRRSLHFAHSGRRARFEILKFWAIHTHL